MKMTNGLALLLACAGVFGVGIAPAGAEIVPLPGVLDLEYSIETDKSIYYLGEEVHAVHRITNPCDVTIQVELFQLPGFDLWALKDGEQIWSYHRAFRPVFGGQSIGPGETLEFEYAWDLTDISGSPVPPGEYEIRGVIYGGAPHDDTTPITVVPEPLATLLLLAGFGVLRIRRWRWEIGDANLFSRLTNCRLTLILIGMKGTTGTVSYFEYLVAPHPPMTTN